MDFSGVVVFHIGDEPERIDFLSKIQGLNFDDAYQQRRFLTINNHKVPILHLNDLIANKLLANRPKDRADIERLLRIQKFKKPE